MDVHASSVRLAAIRADELLEERTLSYDPEAVELIRRRSREQAAGRRAHDLGPVEGEVHRLAKRGVVLEQRPRGVEYESSGVQAPCPEEAAPVDAVWFCSLTAIPGMGYRCDNRSVSAAQNSSGSAGRVRGRPFAKGTSGNPSGRPKGLAKATRDLVGEDGMTTLVQVWWDIARDETRRDRDRLEASRLLADRGWGKPANFEPLEGDPLGLEDVEAAEFRAKIMRLADRTESDEA
jgi:hypothetical protein